MNESSTSSFSSLSGSSTRACSAVCSSSAQGVEMNVNTVRSCVSGSTVVLCRMRSPLVINLSRKMRRTPAANAAWAVFFFGRGGCYFVMGLCCVCVCVCVCVCERLIGIVVMFDFLQKRFTIFLGQSVLNVHKDKVHSESFLLFQD